MDTEPLRLRLLWKWPQMPKRKIRMFIQLGDEYKAKGQDYLAEYCYRKSLELADSIRAVHLKKKIVKRVN